MILLAYLLTNYIMEDHIIDLIASILIKIKIVQKLFSLQRYIRRISKPREDKSEFGVNKNDLVNMFIDRFYFLPSQRSRLKKSHTLKFKDSIL